jgi:hypothetical protein
MDEPSIFLQYGALGLLAFSAVSVAAALWRRLSTEQDAHTKKIDATHAAHTKQLEEIGEFHAKRLEAITAEHKTEMRLLMERLIETHSTQMREYHKLSENMVNVLDSMTRKFERPVRRLPGS